MTIKDVPVGTKFEIKVYNNDNLDKFKTYTSSLRECLDQKTIILDPICYQQQEEQIAPATKINIFLVYNSSRFFIFDGVIMEKALGDYSSGIKVTLITDLLQIRMRENFRFIYEVPVKYRVFNSIDEAMGSTQPFKDSITRDLSGGDMSFISDEELSKNQLVDVKILLDENSKDEIRLFGNITRVVPIMDNDVKKYGVGIIYKSITNTDVNKISKFINSQLVKLRQKGLI